MLETRAVVVETDTLYAQVVASGGNGCSACDGKGCGSGKLTQLFCSRPRRFKVDNRIHAGVGDEVIVAVHDGAVLRGIGLVYLLPLVLLFAGAASAGQLGLGDAYAAVGALSGLVIGFALARWLSIRGSRPQPYIARLVREEG